MDVTLVVLRPDYSGRTWGELPHLAAGLGRLKAEFEARSLTVVEVPVGQLERAAAVTDLLDEVLATASEPLLVYIGGHGLVSRRRHYTALDATPLEGARSTNALWSKQLCELVSGHGKDAAVFIDTCLAGEAVVEGVGEAVNASADVNHAAKFGLVSSCRASHASGVTADGEFVEVLLRVLSEHPTHDDTAWGPGDELVRLGRLVEELRHREIRLSDAFHEGASGLKVLPNLSYDSAQPEGRVSVKLALRRLSRGAEAHLLDKSAVFVGRRRLRAEIVDWLIDRTAGVLVVTGGPGTGKSALVGLLARQSVGDTSACGLGDVPAAPSGAFDAVLHVRQKTLAAVEADLQPFLNMGRRATVLVDALDEAVPGEATGIAAQLGALTEAGRIRMVVGTRPSPVVGTTVGEDPLLHELAPHGQELVVYNLDHSTETRGDILDLVKAALLEHPGQLYDDELAQYVAEQVAWATAPSFLFAHAAMRWLTAHSNPVTEVPDWRERLRSFVADDALGALIEEDLGFRYTGDDLTSVHDLLRALAWSEGLGIPRYIIWPLLAEALSPTESTYNDDDITWVLNQAGWYITETAEDGQTVYRLFHQSLTDFFRGKTDVVASRYIQEVLATRLEGLARQTDGWQRTDPYIRHYLVAHAEQAVLTGGSSETMKRLLSDAEFVAHASADRLRRAVRLFRQDLPGPVGPLLQRCAHLLEGLRPHERLALLDLTAAQERLPPPPPARDRPTVWAPVWANWQPSTPHVTLRGHTDVVDGVAFSPDGALLATVGWDGTSLLWDVTSGDLRATLSSNREPVLDLAFSPDGRELATVGIDRTARLWNLATGKQRLTISGPAYGVAFSPNGSSLATAGVDRKTQLWDVATGVGGVRLVGQSGPVLGLAFSPDGTALATGHNDGTARLWDVVSGEQRRCFVGHEEGVLKVAFLANGNVLATASSDATVRLWDVASGRQTMRFTGHSGAVLGIDSSPDATQLATASEDRTVRLWDVASGRQTMRFTGHTADVHGLAYSPDATQLATASEDRTVRLWDVASGENPARLVSEGVAVSGLALSPDANTLATAGSDGSVSLWDLNSGHERIVIDPFAGSTSVVRDIAFSPDGSLVAFTDYTNVRLHDVSRGEQQATLRHGGTTGVAFSPDGSHLASCDQLGTAILWNIASRRETTFVRHYGVLSGLAFSPNGTILATASSDMTAILWDVSTGKQLASLTDHSDSVSGVAFSPDGTILATTASTEGAVLLWEVEDERLRRNIRLRLPISASFGPLHYDAVVGMAFSPNGDRLATASEDETLGLWDVRRGIELSRLPLRAPATCIAWRRNTIAVGSTAGVAAIKVNAWTRGSVCPHNSDADEPTP